MKRDMDLIRKILLHIEEEETFNRVLIAKVEGYSADEIAYHTLLLGQAGYLFDVKDNSTFGQNFVTTKSLTWAGHEFLDAARNDTNWNKAKTLIKEKAGTVSFEVLKLLLITLAKEAVGVNFPH